MSDLFCEACGRPLEWVSAAKAPWGRYVCPTCREDQSECDCFWLERPRERGPMGVPP